jgi:8-amino-7-oxononanoate synthase
LSKAFGSIGGFVTGPRAAIDTLINAARPFIYTTALPPMCAAAALAALGIIGSDEGRALRVRVQALAERVRGALRGLGLETGASRTPIVPVIFGDPARALAASAFLGARGLWVPAIRPPTVAPGTARLRISLMATHTDEHVERLLDALAALHQAGI